MLGLVGWQIKAVEGLIAIFAISFAIFWVYDKGYHASEIKQLTLQVAADKKQQDRYNDVAQQLEEQKAKRQDNAKTITKVVTKIITHGVYRNECFDSDGMSIANQALSGTPNPTISNAEVPSTK